MDCKNAVISAHGSECGAASGILGFFDPGEVYTALSLLATGWGQLSQRGRRVPTRESAGLIKRVLN